MATSSNAQIGAGVILSYWNTVLSPSVYTVLAAIRGIKPPGTKRQEVDSTTLDSTEMERIAGLPDGQEWSFTITCNSISLALLRLWMTSGASLDFKMVYPSPTTRTEYFTCIPLSVEPGQVQPNGLIEVTFTGRVTGSIGTIAPH